MRFLNLISAQGANGAIIHAVRVTRLLLEHGHEVVVAAWPDGWAAKQLSGVVEVVPSKFERTGAEFDRFTALCRERRIAAINTFVTRAHNFGWRLERRSGVPAMAHGQSHHWEIHWLFQRRVFSVSTADIRRQRRWYFHRAKEVARLPNYADTTKFHPQPRDPAKLSAALGVPPDSTVIACVAEIMPRKAQIDLVQALPAVIAKVPTARVVLFGREGERREYVDKVKHAVTTLGLQDRVVFAGHREDLVELLPQCHAAVLPSLAEPFALGALESMACGLPLIATRVGGFPDMITPGENGALAKPGNPASLAQALLEVVGDESRRAQMAVAARTRVEREFSAEVFAKNYFAAVSNWGLGS